ncbi:sulfatase [Paenibacillus allorhizosphaerae]|uniref:Ulvan-active sulfatase n=1 Tax=Paenibacillus allorhizosphaerae TaxID=2849866 RepID=A0ABM8VQL2_9BACL|nr:sulfatase [Paenibacillus allorhizosphaerae]CAG7654375.1 Ulvan-active sulfatase [Paenibacillus allorhizosphaerae]
MTKKPNLVFVFSDQHRAEAVGYEGNPDVKTPWMDQLHDCSVSFDLAISGAPVCCPARASLLTGQRPLTNGVFVNDVQLNPDAVTIGKVLKAAGYDTAYIGKWHLDGRGRSSHIPPERRQGFDFWRVLECTHSYNKSFYYGNDPVMLQWDGYDAKAQTDCAREYIRDHEKNRPFAMFLSWGPPHDPYHTAPEKYRQMYDPSTIRLRDNVSDSMAERVRKDLAGYYSHISALDDCLGDLWKTLREEGVEEETIFIYTSDHGDMVGSQGHYNKQKPWDESIRVPFLLHWPQAFGKLAKRVDMPFSTIDVMPTLLGLCGIAIPETVQGISFAGYLFGKEDLIVEETLIENAHPFGQWIRKNGGKEFRGIRTRRYTYVRALSGPWLLYDNLKDPFQLNNLIGTTEGQRLLPDLDDRLNRLLEKYNDEFLPGDTYIERWGYPVDENGTVPYTGFI